MKNSENMDHPGDDSVENVNKNSEQESTPVPTPVKEDVPPVIPEIKPVEDKAEAPSAEATEAKDASADPVDTKADGAEAEVSSAKATEAKEESKPEEEKAEAKAEAESEEPIADTKDEPKEEELGVAKTEVAKIEDKVEDKVEDKEKVKEVPKEEAKPEEAKAPSAEAEEAREDSKPEVAKKVVKKEEVEEKVNFELLSRDDLVQLLEEDLNKKAFEVVKMYVDEIRNIFNKKTEKENAEKKEKYLADGGNEEDFKPFEDPASKKMDELLNKVKSLKSDYNKQQEQSKEQNLADKQEILEELRLLMEGQESFDNTFRKFKQLQKRWFDSGFVPQQNVKDLWNSYNYFVDKFNDYVKINRELRALDLKKNLEFKVNLCEKVEELTKEEDVVLAFKTLQKYHAQWRETGPVPREDKDSIWERFKAATASINKAHQSHQSELRVSLVENLEKKEKLCERVEAIAANKFDTHREWNEKTQIILGIQKEWKNIGYAPKKDNNLIYARFRKACDIFFGMKAEFYAQTFELQKDNLKEKEEIVLEAEALKDNTDWKETTNKLINLQKRWKEIGPVPRRDSDRLWKKFRAACDTFFAHKTEFYSDIDSSYGDNLKAKLELIEELKKYKAPKERSELTKELDEFHHKFAEIGFVPVDKKEEVRENFRNAFNDIVSGLDVDEQTKSMLGFRSRLLGIMHSPKADTKFSYEREKLHTKLQQLKNDISVWENNIGFIKQTESSENTISGYQEKLDESKSRIELLEKKIALIDRLENEL